jgi:hypothetical protein
MDPGIIQGAEQTVIERNEGLRALNSPCASTATVSITAPFVPHARRSRLSVAGAERASRPQFHQRFCTSRSGLSLNLNLS